MTPKAFRLVVLIFRISLFFVLLGNCTEDAGSTASQAQSLEQSTRHRLFPNRSWSNPVGDIHPIPLEVNFKSLHLRATDYDDAGALTRLGRDRLSCDQSKGERGEPSVELTLALRSLKGPDYTFVHQVSADEYNTSASVPNLIKMFSPYVQSRQGQALPIFSSTFDLEEQMTMVSGGTLQSEGSEPRVSIRVPLSDFDLRPGSSNALWVAVDQGNSQPAFSYRPNAFTQCSVEATFQPVGLGGDILSHFLAGSCLGIHRPWEFAWELSPLEDSPFTRAICPFSRGIADWKIATSGCNLSTGPFLVNVFGLMVEVLEVEMVDVCPVEEQVDVKVINLRVDTNRDGNLTEADEEREDQWLKRRGAIYLPNIDSDFGFHSSLFKNDASDAVINGPDDLDDLAVMELDAVARSVEALPKNARVTVRFENQNVRLFHRKANGDYEKWLPDEDVLEKEALTQKHEFRIEGKTLSPDESPYLEVTAQLESEDEQGQRLVVSDEVMLRSAPLLFHSHLDAPEQLVISPAEKPAFQSFYQEMRKAAIDTGIQLVEYRQATVSGNGVSKWIQDRFEAGYVSMPKRGGQQQTIRVFLFNDTENLPEEVALLAKLQLGPNVAALVVGDGQPNTFDMAGNLEVVPPLRGFPLGRLLRGSRGRTDQRMQKMLDAQRIQMEAYEDVPVAWLKVGHIDEVVTFVPARNARGWAMMVADPSLALQLLQNELKKGNGESLLFSPLRDRPSAEWQAFTIEVYLQQFGEDNRKASEHVEKVVRVLMQQHALYESADVIRIPVLFFRHEGNLEFSAHTSNLVNGVMLNPSVYVAPKAYGPIVDGQDLFEVELQKKLMAHDIAIRWIDVFEAYHMDFGELHCGSNVIRKIPQTPWWKKYE